MSDYPKVPQQISDPISENLAKLSELFPAAVKDGALDVEALRAELGDFEEIRPGDETYELSQRQHGCANRIIDFIQAFLAPGRFVGISGVFEDHRTKLNSILSLSGLEYGNDGKFRKSTVATTLDEAESRLKPTPRSIFPLCWGV